MTEAKLKLEMQGIRISYDGPADFLGGSLVEVCKELLELEASEIQRTHVEIVEPTAAPQADAKKNSRMSTTDISVKLGVKSGSELVMAAAAQLRLTQGKEEFTRSELLKEMKSAKSFYKQTHSNNLSKSLEVLVKGSRLSSPGAEKYALPHNEETALRSTLGL